MVKKHEGKSTHRLNTNPMEKAYHDEWLESNSGDSDAHQLEWMLGDGEKRGEVSGRDALVAATVIQWLGSPVGQRFLEKTQERAAANEYVLVAADMIKPAYYTKYGDKGGAAQPDIDKAMRFPIKEDAEWEALCISKQRNAPNFKPMRVGEARLLKAVQYKSQAFIPS